MQSSLTRQQHSWLCRWPQWFGENSVMLATPQRVYYVDQHPHVQSALAEKGAGTDGGSAPGKS